LCFDDFAAEMALGCVVIEFALYLLEEKRFVLLQMLFEIGDRIELLLTIYLSALDDSWLSSLVALQVHFKMTRIFKTFTTKLAIVRPNGVRSSLMYL